jgi:hypothetical protein
VHTIERSYAKRGCSFDSIVFYVVYLETKENRLISSARLRYNSICEDESLVANDHFAGVNTLTLSNIWTASKERKRVIMHQRCPARETMVQLLGCGKPTYYILKTQLPQK